MTRSFPIFMLKLLGHLVKVCFISVESASCPLAALTGATNVRLINLWFNKFAEYILIPVVPFNFWLPPFTIDITILNV